MFITSDFEGGNATIISITEEKVTLDVELRDTVEDWFFCVLRYAEQKEKL